jgi:hypothetical protein
MLRVGSTVVSILIVAVAAGSASAQSLAAAAKKEQERRKTATPAKKTYTETDLATGSPVYAPPARTEEPWSGSGTAEVASGQAGARLPEAGSTNDAEAYWRDRFQTARAAIVDAESEVKRWEKLGTRARTNGGTLEMRDCTIAREAKPGEKIRLRSCPPSSTTFMGGLEGARKALADARKALVDLESEARQKGALAAWMR